MEYRALHYWVERQLGKPKYCRHCEAEDANIRYHWANVSRQYKKETSDWIRLCPKCHARYDGRSGGRPLQIMYREFCTNGHRTVLTNLYLRKRGNSRIIECLECRREYVRNHRKNKKEKQL